MGIDADSGLLPCLLIDLSFSCLNSRLNFPHGNQWVTDHATPGNAHGGTLAFRDRPNHRKRLLVVSIFGSGVWDKPSSGSSPGRHMPDSTTQNPDQLWRPRSLFPGRQVPEILPGTDSGFATDVSYDNSSTSALSFVLVVDLLFWSKSSFPMKYTSLSPYFPRTRLFLALG